MKDSRQECWLEGEMVKLFEKGQKKGLSGLGGLAIGLGLAVIILVAVALILARFDTQISDGTAVLTYAENISSTGQAAVFTVASFLGIFAIVGVLVLIIAMLVRAFGGFGGGGVV